MLESLRLPALAEVAKARHLSTLSIRSLSPNSMICVVFHGV